MKAGDECDVCLEWLWNVAFCRLSDNLRSLPILSAFLLLLPGDAQVVQNGTEVATGVFEGRCSRSEIRSNSAYAAGISMSERAAELAEGRRMETCARFAGGIESVQTTSTVECMKRTTTSVSGAR